MGWRLVSEVSGEVKVCDLRYTGCGAVLFTRMPPVNTCILPKTFQDHLMRNFYEKEFYGCGDLGECVKRFNFDGPPQYQDFREKF